MSPASATRELPPPVRRAIDQARVAWPGVELADDVFGSYLLARSQGAALEMLHTDDLYLACGCVRGDRKALELFDRQFLTPLQPVIAQSGSPGEAAVEVLQIVRQRLLVGSPGLTPRLAEFLGTGSLAGWVRVVAVRAALDHRRDERVSARHTFSSAGSELSQLVSPEDAVIQAQYRTVFKQAFGDAFRSLSTEDRLILRLHFAEGLNLESLAVGMSFSRATAGRRLLQARELLRDETLRRISEHLELPPAEIEAALADLRSRLELSMSSLVSAA
jgi:RNA polymerase sigma-70 factor (ECF subfamily)